jgi:hypothetical protein
MNQLDASALLNEDFSAPVRSLFVPAIKRAYVLVDEHANSWDMLKWPVGRDIVGYLRRVAVEFEVKKLIDGNLLKLEYRIAKNAADNCHHLELLSKHSVMTFSQVTTPTAFPRPAIFRNNYSISNQLCWDFNDWSTVKNGPFYVILTHGYGGRVPDFVTLGVPEAHIRGWIVRINLLKEPYQLLESDVEVIKEDTLIELKEFVEKVVRRGDST